MEALHYETKIGDESLIIESGKLAQLASGSVTVRYGDTLVLATAVYTESAREGIDYFPLMVEYEERFYASGKISGSRFIKREGRPSETAVLTARLIDRPLRPLFPKHLRNDLQVIVTVLSYDPERDPDVISIIAASAAVMLSGAPYKGPASAVRVGLIPKDMVEGGEDVYQGHAFVLNPTATQLEKSLLDLVVAGTENKVNMLEAGANEIPEEVMLKAIQFGQKGMQPGNAIQRELVSHIPPAEIGSPELSPILEDVKNFVGDKLVDALKQVDKQQREAMLLEFEQQIMENFEGAYKQIDLKSTFGQLVEKEVRQAILQHELRPDGRKITEIRSLASEVGLIPRAHGSGLFTRGQTQVLTVATLGSPGMEQVIETMEEDTTKRYMHHYNFPPFSTGEAKPIRGASRREIGHGALAERALLPVIPAKEDFPYTVRLVSEVLSSNGSSSMAATCGSTIALMDAGVPIQSPVSGIAMGLVTDENEGETGNYKVLTDLQGLEDFAGDMDFKIAGTEKGITAIQLDVKISGLTEEIITQTLEQAKEGRKEVMKSMLATIPEPRKELSPLAPRILTITIDPKKIGELIGPGGKTINGIIEEVGGKSVTSIDIEEDGTVLVSSIDSEMGQKAIGIIESIMRSVEVGEVIKGTVAQIMKDRNTGKEIGAIVQLTPKIDGMVHISQIADHRVEKIEDEIKVGQTVTVKVAEVDRDRGRISLTMKGVEQVQ
jgi:polyribonucleotide nucleotidyltransferase